MQMQRPQRRTPGPLYLVGKRNDSRCSESNPSSRPVPKSKAPVGSKPSPRLATSDPKPRSFVRIPIERGRPKAAVHQSAMLRQAFFRRKAVNEHGKRLNFVGTISAANLNERPAAKWGASIGPSAVNAQPCDKNHWRRFPGSHPTASDGGWPISSAGTHHEMSNAPPRVIGLALPSRWASHSTGGFAFPSLDLARSHH